MKKKLEKRKKKTFFGGLNNNKNIEIRINFAFMKFFEIFMMVRKQE